ncbi:hypothetical protein O1611_g9026 [Lasiodiplodia mahajangana]|uniref:Uncharacterized protein n=1 Tax=Lasiodiplodia mahajangana TaxID=1108764 RepID=A0ACC2JB91_9PEZI|nr:hypothetical protein O1611_g9026 [Lasiodiplodia mahajangana]
MPRLVRKRPLMERVTAMLNPMDFLLWLSEEIETHDWSSKTVGTQLGLAMNFAFLIARANSGGTRVADPVFDDGTGSSGWLAYVIGAVVWFLMGFSGVNAYYTMYRSRKYRLFEADVEKKPETRSARRVRVQSSPVSSSPLRLLADVMSTESAESRAHPDNTRDVWEIAMWDPLPISLRLFCLFSPGHILVHMMFLPLAPLDARPSVTVFNCLVLQVILSVQLMLFQSRFSQQNKDSSVIQKEVMHEYDTKFVHPLMYPTVRDAGTQFSRDDFGNDTDFVEIGTPTVQLRRGFKTRPNPNYTKHIDPDNTGSSFTNSITNPGFFTPPVAARQSGQFSGDLRNRVLSTKPVQRSTPGPTPLRESTTRVAAYTSTGAGSGGYLGVMSHPKSPLKKAPSLGDLEFRSPRNNGEMAQLEQYQSFQRDRSPSPVKSTRKSTGTVKSVNPQPSNSWGRRQTSYERYPSMFQ